MLEVTLQRKEREKPCCLTEMPFVIPRSLLRGGFIIGRGTVIDTAALIEALQSKRIAGAGLDVLEGEPSVPPLLPELLGFDNVVVTPHCAGRAPEAHAAATALVLANLHASFAGKPLPSPVSFPG